MFTPAIFCLTTQSLPWFMDLTFQVPIQYCSLQHQTLLLPPDTSTTEQFLLWPCLFIPSGAISMLFPSNVLDTFPAKGLIFLCPTFLLFLYMCVCWQLSRVQLFVTPQAIVCQAPLSMGFPRQAYWSGLVAISFSRESSWPGIKPRSPSLQAVFLRSELYILYIYYCIFISRKCD